MLKTAQTGKLEAATSLEKLVERLALIAICFSPFQLALTLKLGESPLKVSEILLVVAMVIYPFTGWVRRKSRGQALLGLFLIIFVLSTFSAVMNFARESDMIALGYTRSQFADIIFYFLFTIFSLYAWKIVSSLDRGKIEKALIVAAWLCILAVLFQQIGIATGNNNLVSSLGFETEGRVDDKVVTTRNGPFKEGQHLGFYSGFLLIICFYKKRWLACLGLIYCVYYSESTTATVGIVAALLILLVLNINVYTIATTLGVSLSALIAFMTVPRFNSFITYQLSKLGFGDAIQVSSNLVSLNMRQLKTEIGWNIMRDNPFLGVGPGRYSIWFFHDPLSAEAPGYYFRSNHRAIAENIYAQVGAETGLFGIILFAAFLAYLFYTAMRMKEISLVAATVFVAIGISTQSMLTFLPVWLALAYLASEHRDLNIKPK